MKILVTGGAGFIGKYLVKFLLEEGHDVIIFDNFSNSTKESISHLIDLGANVFEGDITNHHEIQNVGKHVDIMIHLAAKISVTESILNPAETIRVNVNGTRNVLEFCKQNSVKKLVVASSAAVYGEGNNSSSNERTITNPISPYGKSKIMMEQEIEKFILENKMNVVVLRFFNIFGVGQRVEYAGVITKFIEKIKQKKSLEIFGDGMQKRDFVAIEDVIDSIHKAIISKKNGTYNIASGNSITINELANKIITLSGEKIEIKFLPAKNGDIRYSHADISLAKKDLGFFPKFTLNKIKELL